MEELWQFFLKFSLDHIISGILYGERKSQKQTGQLGCYCNRWHIKLWRCKPGYHRGKRWKEICRYSSHWGWESAKLVTNPIWWLKKSSWESNRDFELQNIISMWFRNWLDLENNNWILNIKITPEKYAKLLPKHLPWNSISEHTRKGKL